MSTVNTSMANVKNKAWLKIFSMHCNLYEDKHRVPKQILVKSLTICHCMGNGSIINSLSAEEIKVDQIKYVAPQTFTSIDSSAFLFQT